MGHGMMVVRPFGLLLSFTGSPCIIKLNAQLNEFVERERIRHLTSYEEVLNLRAKSQHELEMNESSFHLRIVM